MVLASTLGQTAESTQECGKRTRCMVLAISSGPTAASMKESSSMMSSKEKALSSGLMDKSTPASG